MPGCREECRFEYGALIGHPLRLEQDGIVRGGYGPLAAERRGDRANGAHPPTWLMLESIGAVRVRFTPPEAFTNINTRADLAAIAGRLERGDAKI